MSMLEQKENIHSYNTNPRFYEEKFKRVFEEYALPDVERFLSVLSGKKILDMGCGPGIYLEYFREQGFDALGLEIADAFLERCAEKGLNVRKMDMEKPLLYPFSYDGIWALSLVHVPRARIPALVKTWAKLLRPSGVLFISVKKGDGEGFESAETGDDTKRWFTYFSEEEVKKYFVPFFDVLHHDTRVLDNGREWLTFLFKLKAGAVKRPYANR